MNEQKKRKRKMNENKTYRMNSKVENAREISPNGSE